MSGDQDRMKDLYRHMGLTPPAPRDAPGASAPPGTFGAPGPAPSDPSGRLRALLRPIAVTGFVIIFGCLGGFSTWASLAPLSSAAIAPGVVSPDGNRKVVQHLEGGIIHKILVREGDHVKAGQPLVRLESTQAQANFSSRREQYLRLRITKARLDAHAAGADSLVIPDDLVIPNAPEYQTFVANQIRQFDLRRAMVVERESIMQQQIKQLDDEIKSIEIENDGLAEQLRLIKMEVDEKRYLVQRNLVRRPDLYAVQRTASSLTSKVGSNLAAVSRAQQKIEEVRLQLTNLHTQFRDQVQTDLAKVNSDIAQLEEAMIATGDVLRRTEVLAQSDGIVLNLRFHTVGGVVRPGDPILDIVPTEEALIIDAKISPTDIDVVSPGMAAEVQMSAYKSRFTPLLRGEVIQIGADALTEAQTNQRYFPVKIRLTANRAQLEAQGIVLTPGMPADTFVITGQRTMLAYFRDPIVQSFRKAFRED